jgi:hypothetical protein
LVLIEKVRCTHFKRLAQLLPPPAKEDQENWALKLCFVRSFIGSSVFLIAEVIPTTTQKSLAVVVLNSRHTNRGYY